MVENSLGKGERKGRRISSSSGSIVPPFIDDWVRSCLPLSSCYTHTIIDCLLRPHQPVHTSIHPSIRGSVHRREQMPHDHAFAIHLVIPCTVRPNRMHRIGSILLSSTVVSLGSGYRPAVPPWSMPVEAIPDHRAPASCRGSCRQLHLPFRSRLGRSSDDNTPRTISPLPCADGLPSLASMLCGFSRPWRGERDFSSLMCFLPDRARGSKLFLHPGRAFLVLGRHQAVAPLAI